jgi:cell division protein FtsL
MVFSFEQLMLLIILALVVAILYGIRRIYTLERAIKQLDEKISKKIKK